MRQQLDTAIRLSLAAQVRNRFAWILLVAFVPVWYLLLFIPLVHILSALPLSLGGVGVREGGYVVFLALIGIGRDEALAFGLLWSALVLGSGLVGGLVLLLLPEARFSLASVRKTRDGSG